MPTELLTIYYNGHFTQMVYPEQIETQLNNYALPMEDIDIIQYPAGSVVAPFNVGPAQELNILKVEEPPPPPPGDDPLNVQAMSFKTVLREIIATPEGLEFVEKIRSNNKKLNDSGLAIVPMEATAREGEDPVFYSIVEVVNPVVLVARGNIVKEYKTGWLDKLNPDLWGGVKNDSALV